jgi:hypothetical protein
VDRLGQIVERPHFTIGRERETGGGQESLLANALLRGVQDRAAGPDGGAYFCGGGRGCRNIFELECYDADLSGEGADLVEIVVGRGDLDVGDLAGGCVRIRRKGMYTVAHAARRDCEHASELAASEDSNGRARKDRLHDSSSDRTRAVCSSRKRRSFSRNSGS